MRVRLLLLPLMLSLAAVGPAAAEPTINPTIYPLDRSDILAGAHFDLKVEFGDLLDGKAEPIKIANNKIDVTINGQDAAKVLGASAQIVRNEDGEGNSAYWIKNVQLPKPGHYKIIAKSAGRRSTVSWDVFDTPPRAAKNVILFIGDGMAGAHRTAARILAKGIKEGKFNGELAIDDMPHMALVSTAGMESVVPDSANSMSTYTTGHKTCVNAMGVICAKNSADADHPRVENIAELVQRRQNMQVGVVSNAEITDATPAAVVAHTRWRTLMSDIVPQFFEVKPDVILGGGSKFFLTEQNGGERRDGIDYIKKFAESGYATVSTNKELKKAVKDKSTQRLLGLFNAEDIDGALDLKYMKRAGTADVFPDQPDLVDQTRAALDVLSRRDNGFFLMIESARIDKYSHNLDWERAVYDTIMLDNAVKVAKEFAAKRNNDTLIIIVADHGTPVSLVGTYRDDQPGNTPRDKIRVYGDAGFPNYPPADSKGYPPTAQVSRRLAMAFGAYPDHCFTGKLSTEHQFVPAQDSANPDVKVANEENCIPGSVRVPGNIPPSEHMGVHSGDDVILTASGPGADMFHGHIDNTYVFRVIATMLGLSEPQAAAQPASQQRAQQ